MSRATWPPGPYLCCQPLTLCPWSPNQSQLIGAWRTGPRKKTGRSRCSLSLFGVWHRISELPFLYCKFSPL
ncbi:hypothetical protein LEMLEM_LOCUS5059 [Lemmus lemmus]